MDKSRGKIWITLICFIIGVMLVMQLKSINALGGLVTTQRADEMLRQIEELNKKNEALETRAFELQNSINSYESQASDDNSYIEKLLRDVDSVKEQAGLIDLVGPGITITLDYKDSDNFDPFVFYSESLLLLVNELNAAGAEAISINNERIINASEIRLAGSHININGKKNTYPFVFKVIGDPKTLKSAINIRGGIVELMQMNYIDVQIKEDQNVTVNKYNGTVNLKYAKPVETE